MKHRWTGFALLTCAAAFVGAAPEAAHARVAPTSLEELSRSASVAVVAHVRWIERVEGTRLAHAVVVRALDGLKVGQEFTFLAQPTWTCDDSTAVWGETAILLLEQPRGGRMEGKEKPFTLRPERIAAATGLPFFAIAWSGRGRIPVHRDSRGDFVRAWKRDVDSAVETPSLPGVRFPAGMPAMLEQGMVQPDPRGWQFRLPLSGVLEVIRSRRRGRGG